MYRRLRSAALATLSSLAIALALVVLPSVGHTATAMTVAPPASDQDCAAKDHLSGTEGQFNWAFKDSWVNYISNKGFEAHWTLDKGAKWDEKAQHWSFPVKKAEYNKATKAGKVEYGGLVHFYSHPWPGKEGEYQLDMTWADPILEFNGKTGSISMLVTSRDLSTFEIVDYKRLTVAHFTDLSYDEKAGTFSAKTVTFDGKAEAAFNHEYKDGLALAPINSPVKLTPTKCPEKKQTETKPEPPKTDGDKAPATGDTDKGNKPAPGDKQPGDKDKEQTKPGDKKPGTPTPTPGDKKPGLDDQGDKGKPVGSGGKDSNGCTIDHSHFVGTTGQLAWGFKESWQKYISNKGFAAHWELSPSSGWDSAKKQWTWKVDKADFNLSTHDLKIQYKGTVHFLSHPAGDGSYLLDMKWINPIYVYSMKDNSAKIQMHVISRDEQTQEYVDFGLIDFAVVGQQKVGHGQQGDNFNFSLSATKVYLTEAAAKVFGAYKKGTELLGFDLNVPLSPEKTCPNQPKEPSKPVEEPTKPTTSDQPETPKEPSNQNPAPPAHNPLQPANPPAAPHHPQKKVCKPDPNLMRVTGGTLNWGLRSSFTTYIRGLAKGGWQTSGGVYWNGSAFVFPAGYGTYNKATRTGTINYNGMMHFTGHHGILNLKLWNPTLSIRGNEATLYLSGHSTDTSGKAVPVGRVAFATMHLDRLSLNGNQLSFSASNVYLTAAGTRAFAGFYKVGERLDGLSSTVTLAQATSCDPNTGELLYLGPDGKYHKLAKTGTELYSLLMVTLALGAAGSLTIAARRRVRSDA